MADAALTMRAGANLAARPKLDDLMLSMDVVDTLRHQESLVARELNETQREAELIQRLREIYRGQGIEVSDRIIMEGVKALKESRFVYTPPKPGFAVTLARLWVSRGRIAKFAILAIAVLAIGWLAHAALVKWPAQRAAERTRVELTETLPKALNDAVAEVKANARIAVAMEKADQLLADGRAALARKDMEGARKSLAALADLRAQLRQEYKLLIVSRPGERSGVWRIPDRNRNARNYYLIVEAIGSDGKTLSMPIKSEEDGATRTVTKWGVRVSSSVFDAVRRDKSDDGILQRNQLGEKRRGYLDVDFTIPVQGGAITQW